MKVLVVCSSNFNRISTYILEQVDSLKNRGVEFEYFYINGKGMLGYLKNAFLIRKQLKTRHYDLVHAHYGLSGLASIFQRVKPVVVSFHGSDVNVKRNRFFSKLAANFSRYNILVEESFVSKLKLRSKYQIISCGIDFNNFVIIDKMEARQKMNLFREKKYVLFSSHFSNHVKNYPLAKEAFLKLKNAELIELKGYSRAQINLLMNACDALLVTSFNEGGPLVVKEALACNLPVVSVDVGDVKKVLQGVKKSFIVPYSPEVIASRLNEIFEDNDRTNGRMMISNLDMDLVAEKIHNVYKQVLKG